MGRHEALSASPPPEAPTEALARGKRLRNLREDIGLSQAQLATKARVAQGYLCQLERGEVSNEGYLITIELARALGAGINFLEGQTDERVFLRPEAHLLYNFLKSPHSPVDPTPIQSAFQMFIESIPKISGPDLIYIEHSSGSTNFGEKLFRRRMDLNLTQGQVATGVTINQGTLSQLEGQGKNKIKNPPINSLQKVASFLGIDIHDLLDLEQIHCPDVVVHVDRFFRSDQIPPESKKRTRTIINSLIDLAKDPTFARPEQESPIPTQ